MNIALTRDGLSYNLAIGTEEYSLESAPQFIKKDNRLFVRTPFGEQWINAPGNTVSVEGVDVSAQDAATMRTSMKGIFFLADTISKIRQKFSSPPGYITPVGLSSTTIHVGGMGNANTGTVTARTWSNATALGFDAYRKVGFVGAAANDTQVGWRNNNQALNFSNSNDRGGFLLIMGWAYAGAVNPNARFFAGVGQSAGLVAAGTDPSTFNNIAAFAADAGDANLQFMCNDNSGAATKIDLGANFPKASAKEDVYRAAIWNLRGLYRAGYFIHNRIKNKFAMGIITNNIPVANTSLAFQVTFSSGTNGTPIAPELEMIEGTELFYP
jgi:hypothetical protein